MTDPRIILFQVRDPQTKLNRLIETAHAHFEKKEPLLIFVDDAKAALFVDDLLWKMPAFGFLPHAIIETMQDESLPIYIAITKEKSNLNQAKAAFNLCATPLMIEGPFKIIYDFEDLTSLSRQHLSTLRFEAYKNARYVIEAR